MGQCRVLDLLLSQHCFSGLGWVDLERIVSAAWSCYPQALATGVAAGRADGAAEGGPAVLLPPGQGLIGVPRRAVGANTVQVPVILSRVVVVVRRPDVGRLLRAGRRGDAEQHGDDGAHLGAHRHDGFASDENGGGMVVGIYRCRWCKFSRICVENGANLRDVSDFHVTGKMEPI